MNRELQLHFHTYPSSKKDMPHPIKSCLLRTLALFAVVCLLHVTSIHRSDTIQTSRLKCRNCAWREGRRYMAPAQVLDRNRTSNRIYTAQHNGRKYMASVVTMANAAEVYGPDYKSRLPSFLGTWSRAWPGLHIQLQYSFANNMDHLLGYGSLVGHYLAIADSLRYLDTHNETCDYQLMFEDDAIPFRNATWPWSSARNNLDTMLDGLIAAGGNFMVMGGTAPFRYKIDDAVTLAEQPQGGALHVGHVDGAYAYIFECSAMASAMKHMHEFLRQATGKVHVEAVLWDAFRSALPNQGKAVGAHVSVPLIVDHKPGKSATLNKVMDNSWFEGDPRFWASNRSIFAEKKGWWADYPRHHPDITFEV